MSEGEIGIEMEGRKKGGKKERGRGKGSGKNRWREEGMEGIDASRKEYRLPLPVFLPLLASKP
jgi:hypothetical protein